MTVTDRRPATVVPARSDVIHTPRRPPTRTTDDTLLLVLSVLSSLSINWLAFARFTDGVGWFAFLAMTFVGFVVIYYVVVAEQHGSLVAADRLAGAVITSASFVLLIPLGLLIGYVAVKGLPALRPSFFVNDQAGITPTMPATAGGGAHAIVGSLQQTGLAVVVSVPLGLACAVFLTESRSRFRRPVQIFVDAMSGLPSIVAGLFIFAVLIQPLAGSWTIFNFDGFMASLALSMIMLPTVTRTVTVVLRLVPNGLREASLALGASRSRTVWSVVLPTARTGITTAVVLGLARVVGETAPLLFTAFGNDLTNANPFDGPQEALPLFVFRNIVKPDESAIQRGFAGALVLLLIVVALFVVARAIGNRAVGGRRSTRRRIRRRGPDSPGANA